MTNTTAKEIAPYVCPIKVHELANALVFYHAHCLDGFGAAYLVREYARNMTAKTNIMYVPISYENELEKVKVAINALNIVTGLPKNNITLVMFIDFCPSEDTMASVLNNVMCRVVVLDHHESHKDLMFNYHMQVNTFAYYSDKLSGVGLVHEYLYGADQAGNMPVVLASIQDRDLWQFKYSNTKDICAALDSTGNIPRDFVSWRIAMNNFPNAAYKGSILNKDFRARCDKVADTAMHLTICTGKMGKDIGLYAFTAYVVNATYEYASEVGNVLVSRYNNAAIVWQYTERRDVKCSVRSNDESLIDAKTIAEAFGGGGHKHAAGFTVGIEEWAAMLDMNTRIVTEEIHDTE